MPLITAEIVGLCLRGFGTAILAVRTYLSHNDSKITRKAIMDKVKSTVNGQDALLYNIDGAINRIERISRDTLDTINSNSKFGDYKHIYIAFEFLEQANLCTNEETAIRYIDCAHQHFTEAFIGLGFRTDMTTDEMNNICQAKIGDAMCCYYLNDPVNACRRLYESNLERPGMAFLAQVYNAINKDTNCSLVEPTMFGAALFGVVAASAFNASIRALGPAFFRTVKQTNEAADGIAGQYGVDGLDGIKELRIKSFLLQEALNYVNKLP